MKKGKESFYFLCGKRIADVIFALLLALPAGFVVAACYIFIKLETKGPAFFVQDRPGKNGSIFKIYKLRTMRIETEENGKALTDMERMTKAGRIIRAFSFDELPQIWNIIKGDMSFIGPRPLLPHYLQLYSPEQMRRHEVRPGISGWAQVNGRNELSWEQKFTNDVWYVDNICFAIDWKIFVKTIGSVLRRESVNANVNETMKGFERKPTDEASEEIL